MTIDLHELRAALKASKAEWIVPETVTEQSDLAALTKKYAVGLLPEPAGTLTARLPRIRRDTEAAIRPWVPNSLPMMRAAAPLAIRN